MTTLALSKLRFGHEYPGANINSRIAGRDAEIAQLAASIKTEGQLMPLLVVKAPKGEVYYTIDGNRRLAALKSLQGADKTGLEVEVKVQDGLTPEAALRQSLAANTNVPLHPADRAETFARLNKEQPAEQIADAYGMTVRAVQQSIALGSALAPAVLQAWRNGKLKQEAVQVFTLAEIEDQESALADLVDEDTGNIPYLNLSDLRRKFTAGKDAENRRLLGFVGVDAARAAGIEVREDFFGKGGVVSDGRALKKLAREKLDEICADLGNAGWLWTEARMARSHMMHGYGEMRVKPEYTPAEADRLAQIKTVLGEIEADENHPADEEALEAEQERIKAEAVMRAYSDKQKAKGGVLVSLNNDGTVHFEPGLTRKEEPKADPKTDKKAPKPVQQQREPEPLDYKVKSALEDWQNEAAGELLVDHPREAVALFLAAVGIGSFNAPIDTDLDNKEIKITKAKTFAAAYDEFKSMPSAGVVDVLAQAVAKNARVAAYNGERKEDADTVLAVIGEKQFAEAVAKKFKAAVYFGGASKRHMLGVVAEAYDETARAAAEKKSDVELRKDLIANIGKTGWLPPQLRTTLYTGPAGKPKSVAAPAKKKKAR